MIGEWELGWGQGEKNAPLRLLEASFPTIETALAHEEALLAAVESRESPATLLLWEWPTPAVIVGRSNVIAREVNEEACARESVPILRRCSGGGAVVLGRGCLCYALILPVGPEHRALGISAVTQAIMQRTALGFRTAGLPVSVAGISDLVLENRKFSGNSQRWLKAALLHHGTILYDFELSCIPRYLHAPSRQPDYRESRDHSAFVRNVPITKAEVMSDLVSAWEAVTGAWNSQELACATDLLATRYSDREWHRGPEYRTP